MSDQKKPRIPIPESLKSGHYATKESLLEVDKGGEKLFIGVPKETILQENRIALVPSGIRSLVAVGYRIMIETGAGEKANFSDNELSEAGAEIVYSKQQVYQAEIILKVAPPTLEEVEMMRPNQILISPLHLPLLSSKYIERLRQKKVIALAMEYIQDNSGSYPIVRIMSELAGVASMQVAAELLADTKNGRGVLLGGIAGVPPATVVILGAGMVAEYATRTALGMGAEVRIYDNNISKLKRIQNQLGRQIFTSVINPHSLKKQLMRADVAIGAIHSTEGRAPVVVSEEMVMNMKKGSVIVDVSIDQGGCFATSEITSLDKPSFVKHDVVHYCVPNIASKYPRTSSISMSNILMPLLILASENRGIEQLLFDHFGLRHGVYVYKGSLTNDYLGRRFEMKSTNLELLIASSRS